MKLSGIKYLADQGVENIWKNKMMAFATFCVLLISLLLVGTATLIYINMDSMIVGLNDKNEIAVYLNINATDDEVKQTEAEIRALPNVKDVEFKPKEEALKRQKELFPSAESIFNDYIKDDASFMSDGFSVIVKDSGKCHETTSEIAALRPVTNATSAPQVAEFLRELRRVVTIVAGAIVIALAAVSMIMISNTTKASVFARREEIQIMKYVGATNAFIRLPFFVEGMVTGLFAGIGGFFITWAAYKAIFNVMMEEEYFMSAIGMGHLIPFNEIRIWVLVAYIVAGAFIGALGSVISTKRHIDV
ncbi:MAG: permease-like cell division protein FtsX [Ruminococcus sp.]|nr:permease-like cell division protein FtsX [Ruminococcus sp.]